jgi:hypothetical protein
MASTQMESPRFQTGMTESTPARKGSGRISRRTLPNAHDPRPPVSVKNTTPGL